MPSCPPCFEKFKGAVFLGLVIVIWVGSAVLIQSIFTSGATQFEKPLFLTYFSTSFFMVYLIPVGVDWHRIRAKAHQESLKSKE